MVITAIDDVDRDQSDDGTVSVRDRIHEFDVLFQPTPFYRLQRSSPWRTSPDVAASPGGSSALGQLSVKAAVARYDGDMFRKQTLSTQVNDFNPFNASCSKLLLFEGFSAILV